jgi:uncharacterized membrane protein
VQTVAYTFHERMWKRAGARTFRHREAIAGASL